MSSSLTAYCSLERDLALTVREAALDYESFQTPLRVCDLSRCGAMCCHDGVFVGAEERAVIEKLFPGEHFEQRGGKVKTRTIPADEGELGEGFPEHFPRTRCCFLDEENHCLLQSRALAEGRHPWFWKPFPCWLHPLSFRTCRDSGRPLLSLPTRKQESSASPSYPGFASYTTCGLRVANGIPAWQALATELEFLSRVSGRDLLAEFAMLG